MAISDGPFGPSTTDIPDELMGAEEDLLPGLSDEDMGLDQIGVMPPDDYLSEATPEDGEPDVLSATTQFLRDMRKAYHDDVDQDQKNRDAAAEDLNFVAGDQWEKGVEQRRLNANEPVLTFNLLFAFVNQITGSRRANMAAIDVLPDTDGDKAIAGVRQGLIRAIEKRSKAKIAYDQAHFNQVACGDGAWQVELEYAHNDVFTQNIAVKQIPNALSVVWDRMSIDPTGADAEHVFVTDSLAQEEFKKRYPNAQLTSFAPDRAGIRGDYDQGWFENNTIRVVTYWRLRTEMRNLILTRDRQVVDVTDKAQEEWAGLVAVNPATGQPYVRTALRTFAEAYIANGVELLEGPYRLPISRVPVFRAKGWEIHVNERRDRGGVVRFMKDPQRLYNYWRSTIALKLMEAPSNTWLAPDAAVEGREDAFRDAAFSKDPLLVYNAESGRPPELQQPATLEPALLQEANMAQQDLRDISNMHEASLGIQGNEVSGRALTARQRQGEIGQIIYQDNLNLSIEETGRVINELLPYVYDTVRQVTILGEDDEVIPLQLNGEGGVDISGGKYLVSVSTGPSFETRRQEAAESMLNMVNAMPQTLAVAADKIIEAQDWPGAEEIARRLRLSLPPGIAKDDELTPQQQQARAQAAQVAREDRERAVAAEMAEVSMKNAQAADFAARAEQASASAAKTRSEIGVDAADTASKIEERENKFALDVLETEATVASADGE